MPARLTTQLEDLVYVYTVYDHTGAVMIRTHSLALAEQYLELAQQGISARFYHFLERYNWQIPRRYLDWL